MHKTRVMVATASVLEFPTILTLPYDADLLDMCNAGRSAALTFLNNAMTASWNRLELDDWLEGPYAAATAFARSLASPDAATPEATMASHDDADVVRTLWMAHRDALEFLTSLPEPTGTGSFVVACVRDRLVVRAEARGGAPCWVPRYDRHQTLSERLQSLVAADYLMRTEDYGSQLAICSRCNRVEFDALSRMRGMCLDETPSSMRVGRRDTEISALLQYR